MPTIIAAPGVLHAVQLHRLQRGRVQQGRLQSQRQRARDHGLRLRCGLELEADLEPGEPLQVLHENLIGRKADHHPGHRNRRPHRHHHYLVERPIQKLEAIGATFLPRLIDETAHGAEFNRVRARRMGADHAAIEPDQQHQRRTDARTVVVECGLDRRPVA